MIQRENSHCVMNVQKIGYYSNPPAVACGGVINSPRSNFLVVFFSASKVELPLVGDTAGISCVSQSKHSV